MNELHRKLATCAAAALTALTLSHSAYAQSNEALLDALVKKGVLTEQEAEDLKADLAKENKQFNKFNVANKEVKNIDVYGDFRGRYEGFYDYDGNLDRHRFRYRVRAGITVSLTDTFEAGLRLTSAEAASGTAGGDPISGNQTLSDNGSKKNIYVDLAYGKWSPEWDKIGMSITIGKMMNPYVTSDMVFDQDYTPEGAATEFRFKASDKHLARFIVGAHILDELGASANDPYMLGAQARLESTWNDKVKTTFGVAGLAIVNEQNLTTGNIPNQNSGNRRRGVGAAGVPAANFNPVVLDGAVTYSVPSMPLYQGAFPITLAADYMNNLAEEVQNVGYSAGLTFGKAGKKGGWEIGYRYKNLEGDAWFEELVDSDFGAIYRTRAGGGPRNSDAAGGYRAGTNVRGHIFHIGYSPFNALTLGVKYFHTELIEEFASGTTSEVGRLQVDANWKF